MKKLKILLLCVILALPIVVTTVATAQASCSEGILYVAQNQNGGGVTRSFCFPTDIPNLANVSGTCNGISHNWNDCISSVKIPGSSNGFVCLWTNAGYTGNGLRLIGPVPVNQSTWYNLPGGTPPKWNDAVSSIEWGINCLTD